LAISKELIEEDLATLQLQECKSISTPLPISFKLSPSVCRSSEAERMKNLEYRTHQQWEALCMTLSVQGQILLKQL